jgi:hypothetical protein
MSEPTTTLERIERTATFDDEADARRYVDEHAGEGLARRPSTRTGWSRPPTATGG